MTASAASRAGAASMVGLLTVTSPLLRMRNSLWTCNGILVNVWCGLMSPPQFHVPARCPGRVCAFVPRLGAVAHFGAKRVSFAVMKHLTQVLLALFWKFGGPGLLVL